MQQESRLGMPFLWADGKVEDSPRELATIQASHAETVLELQKTRHLLLLEHRISKDLQAHTHTNTSQNCTREFHSQLSFLYRSNLTEVQSNFLSQGGAEHCQPEDGERDGGGQEEGVREKQTFSKESSSDQHFARYKQQH